MANELTKTGAFRVPNSIIQGLTTETVVGLNRLNPLPMMTLLGLLTLIDEKHPEAEVAAKVSEILEIIEVSREVAHEVQREWETESGSSGRRTYNAKRFSPAHVEKINKAMLSLHDQKVVVRRRNRDDKSKWEERTVHVLDSFGYAYIKNGRRLDMHHLPRELMRINVGNDERPVYRLRRLDGERNERVSEVLFRLNRELADEINRGKGTIGFTLIAKKVFRLFREFRQQPALIRLTLLVLRQTDDKFGRNLSEATAGLGLDGSHPTKAIEQLGEACRRLHEHGLIVEFAINPEADKLTITRNREWHKLP